MHFKMKKILSILGQTVIISAITFALTEATFRIYHRINPSFMFYDTTYNRWRGKPHAEDYDFRLNSQGFKDVEFSQQKSKDTYRIIGIGDSFAYGVVPYQYNYLTLIEEQINRNNQKKVELLNMGLIGIGPKDYLSLLVNEGLGFNPDMVLLSFYIGNDFVDNTISRKERKMLSDRDSYVITFFKTLIEINSKYEGHIHFGADAKYVDDEITFPEDFYLNLVKDKSLIFVRDPAEPEYFQRDFNEVLGDLLKIKEICDYRNIKLVIVLIPDELQVNPEVQRKVAGAFNVDLEVYDFRLPNQLLAEEFEKNNIYYIDVLDDFVAAHSDTLLYKPNDTHWNIAGNKLAAEVIEKYLSERFFD